MKQQFQEMEQETILPGTSSSFLNSEFCDPAWSFASQISNSSSFMSPNILPSLDVEDLINGNLVMDVVQSFPVATSSPVYDHLLQQSPLGTDNYFNMSQTSGSSRWSFKDSYATSSLENLASSMVARGSIVSHFEHSTNTIQKAEESSVMESADELGKLVRKPTSVCTFDESSRDDFVESLSKHSRASDLSWWFPHSDSLGDDLSCAMGIIPPSSNMSNDFECKKPEKWDNNLRSAMSGQNWDYGTSSSGCTSEHSVGSKRPSNTLFSNLGLDQLLYGAARSSCSFDRPGLDNQSSKRRRFESFLPSGRETVTKFNTGSWIGDSCSINVRNDDFQVRHEKPSKTIKKKAKPGSRPIPKDRLQTYACLAELRELVPNGEKMSIDRLLQRTIKQLHFLQSVTKHAKRFAKTEALKDRKDQKHSNNVANGVTWACEIENETMICPLIVEDLSTPGQMLIEILCQEQGFFLEIVDIIRGFGLNILKGFMKVHEAKICAHYIVEAEANRFVSRHEIFSSLVQLLQLTGPSEFSPNDQHGNVRDEGISLLNNSPQSAFPAPASLPDRTPCMSSVPIA